MLRRPARNRVPGDPPPAPAADDDLGHDDILVALGRAQGVVDAAIDTKPELRHPARPLAGRVNVLRRIAPRPGIRQEHPRAESDGRLTRRARRTSPVRDCGLTRPFAGGGLTSKSC